MSIEYPKVKIDLKAYKNGNNCKRVKKKINYEILMSWMYGSSMNVGN